MAATATATKRPPAKRRQWVIDWPVSFGRYGNGDDTGSIGVKVDGDLVKDLNGAREALAGTRITGRLVQGRADHARGQSRLAYDEEIAIEATFDCKSFLTSGKKISFGLTFNLKDLGDDKQAILSKFAKHDGRFQVASVSAIGGDPDDDDDDEEDEEEDDE